MEKSRTKFFWYDVMTTDVPAALTFYKNVVGWNAAAPGVGGQPYIVFSAQDVGIGGVMPIPDKESCEEAKPCWNGYIWVDNVDEYLERVKAAGGAVLRGPMDLPGVGRMAVAADPFGASFMLFRPSSDEPRPSVAPGTPGHIGWHELRSSNPVQAWDFYAALFGWTKVDAMDMGALGVYQIFAMGAEPAGGMMAQEKDSHAPHWLFYFTVEALDKAIEQVKAGGGTLKSEPHQVPGDAWIVHCVDPQGAEFALTAAKR
jgi:uncharacterized protein